MSDYESMKATKTTRKYSYQKSAEKSAKHPKTYSYEKSANKPRKKYSYEKDLERAAKKGLSKAGIGFIIALVVILAVSAVAGFFGVKYFCKNDTFAMTTYSNGQIDITIGANEDVKEYVEMGAKCISFRKDRSAEVEITYYYRADLSETQVQVDEVDETKGGMYYAVYTTKVEKYRKTTLIRNIYVTGVEE